MLTFVRKAILCLCFIGAGCATQKNLLINPMMQAWGEAPYHVGADDILRVSVLGEAELTQNYRVSASGNISMPMIGQVDVNGKTINHITQTIISELSSNFIRSPQVAVQVERYRPFFISGEVTNSAQFDFFSGVTVRRAIAMAGGYTEFADKRYAIITRLVNGQPIGGEVPLDFTIYPGDVIEIPQKKIAPNLSLNKQGRRSNAVAMHSPQVVQVEEQVIVETHATMPHHANARRRSRGFFGKFKGSSKRGARNIANSSQLVTQYPQYAAGALPPVSNTGAAVYDWSQGRVVHQARPQMPLSPAQSQMHMARHVAAGYQSPPNPYYAPNAYSHTKNYGDYSAPITDPANQSIVAPNAFEPAHDLQRTYYDPTVQVQPYYYPTR